MSFFEYETASTAERDIQLDVKDMSGLKVDFAKIMENRAWKKTYNYQIVEQQLADFLAELKVIHAEQTVDKIESCVLENNVFRLDFSMPERYNPHEHYSYLVAKFPKAKYTTNFGRTTSNLFKEIHEQECNYLANVYNILESYFYTERHKFRGSRYKEKDTNSTFEIDRKSASFTQRIIFCINFLLHFKKDQSTKGILIYPSKLVISTVGDYKIQLYYTSESPPIEDVHDYADFKTYLEGEMARNKTYLITDSMLYYYISHKCNELGRSRDVVTKAVYNAFEIIAKFQSLYSSFSFYTLGLFCDQKKDCKLFDLTKEDKKTLKMLGFNDDIKDPFYKAFFLHLDIDTIEFLDHNIPKRDHRKKFELLEKCLYELYNFTFKSCALYQQYIKAIAIISVHKNNTIENNTILIRYNANIYYEAGAAYVQSVIDEKLTLKAMSEEIEEYINKYNIEKPGSITSSKHITVLNNPSAMNIDMGKYEFRDNPSLLDLVQEIQLVKGKILQKIQNKQKVYEVNIIEPVNALRSEIIEKINCDNFDRLLFCETQLDETGQNNEKKTVNRRIQSTYENSMHVMMIYCHRLFMLANMIPDQFNQILGLIN